MTHPTSLLSLNRAAWDAETHAAFKELEEARAEQWRMRRDAEGSRDAARAAADSLRIERDSLREAMEGIVHFSDALNYRNDHLSNALRQWIEAGRAALDAVSATGEA
jgi:hypothetical protein